MKSDLTADLHARKQAIETGRSFLVQAPAGSGKTELLIQRYLALLAQADEPEAVLAITFTRKAAGEMRNRVLKALDQAERGPAPGQDHAKTTFVLASKVLARDRVCGWKLRQMPARLRIQTIDSLCAAIAHAMPARSGFGGMPEVTESPGELYAAAAHATVLLLGSESAEESAAVATLLRHVDNNVATLEELIVGMLQRRDQWLRLIGNGAEDVSVVRGRLDQNLERIICRCLRRLREAVPPEHAPEIAELCRFAAQQPVNAARAMRDGSGLTRLPGCSAADVGCWLAIADLLLTGSSEWRSPKGINRSLGFPAGDDEVPERGRLQELLGELKSRDELLAALHELRQLPPAAVTDEQWPVMRALFCLLPRAVAQLRVMFAESGSVDFAEVAQAASRALGTYDTPTDLAIALGCRIEHLLVDEYQDTSVTQQELLEKLTASWEPGEGRTAFLVGDPMQSIYRFRQAEVGLFLDAARNRRFGSAELELLTLQANFRSQEGIVEWVNDTFQQVFPPVSDMGTGAVPYTAAVAANEVMALPAVEVHPFIGRNDRAEAECVLHLIEQARARDPQGRITVLVRGRPHLADLVPLLRQRSRTDSRFRFRAVEIDSLAQRQTVLELAALTRALLNLGDRISWLTVLRAPWCGLTLPDLYLLCAKDSESCLWSLMGDRAAQLSPDGQQRLARVREVFATALADRGRVPLVQAVRGLWLELGGPACVSQTDMEDAATFFDLLEGLGEGGDLPGTAQFEARLQDLFAAPDVNADGTLQLMTIHKAKGLEFDTVIVPGLGRKAPQPERPLLVSLQRAAPGDAVDLLIAPIKRKGGETDPLYQYIQRVDAVRGAEEQKRLLYVAATRAKVQLHLLGHAEVNGKGVVKAAVGSLLAHLWPVVRARFEQSAFTQAPETLEIAASAEPSSPWLRLPSGWSTPAAPPTLVADLPAAAASPQISFDWASETARHVGTVTHAVLHKIARDGLGVWNAATTDAHREAIRGALRECGVGPAELERAVERVQAAVTRTLADERGRWLLGDHKEARSEFAVTGLWDGQPRRFKLDRTFVDNAGVRWIVDYKTGEREGAGREEFIENEVRRYREQLQNYARTLQQLDSRPIKLGLYFPLLGAWREVE